ncbi:hypothetical protein ACHHYP_07741 [Achlya hypogyna]|uniref:Secreted protein n=1 Tax=Achlya hypogyna TaxID=1202772 RepID=A0A1V9ZLG8_ACHHY|nr:hypothetical protein ACHHYP_07741 [Achlya hypogyna]
MARKSMISRGVVRLASLLLAGATAVAQPSYSIVSPSILTPPSLASFPFLPPVLVQGEVLANLIVTAAAPMQMALNVTAVTDANASFVMVPPMIDCRSAAQQSFSLQVTSTSASVGNYTLTFYAVATGGVVYSTSVLVVPPPPTAAVTEPAWTGMTIFNDSFDAQAFGSVPNASMSIWQSVQQGFVSDTCTKATGNALYFTHLSERSAATSPLDLRGLDLQLSFSYVYGFRPNQTYDRTGNNTLSCVRPNPTSPFSVEFQALNESAWQVALQVPVPPTPTAALQLVRLPLPPAASSTASSFRWIQHNQTSGRVGAIRGTRYQWQYRNLFDHWAIDDVLLVGRVQAPAVTASAVVAVDTTTVTLVMNATQGVVLTTVGDGAHPFPVCNFSRLPPPSNASVVLTTTSVIHAVTCLAPNQQSYGYRSPRYYIQSPPPTINSAPTPDGYFNVTIMLPRPNMTLRFTFGDGTAAPSCTRGAAVVLSGNASVTSLEIRSNGVLQVVACQAGLLGSRIVRPVPFVVQPPPPIYTWNNPSNVSTTALFNVTLTAPQANTSLISVIVDAADTTTLPRCPTVPIGVVNATYSVQLRPREVLRAVTCCVTTICDESPVATFGPVVASAAPPTLSSQCSTTAMVTALVMLVSGTTTGIVRYAVNSNAVDCTALGSTYEASAPLAVTKPVSGTPVIVTAITCVPGLQPSAPLVATVPVLHCCANALRFPSADPALDCSAMLLFRDEFVDCNTSQWTPWTTQFGGVTVNGGVHASNVQCSFDPTLNLSVLELSAHGDGYARSSPLGVTIAANGSVVPRAATSLFSGWALPGSPPFFPCNPRVSPCAARRVGASVSTVAQWPAGIASFLIQPCTAFGTSSDVWLQNLSQLMADVATVGTSYVGYADLWRASLAQERAPPPFPDVVYVPLRTDTKYHRVFIQWNGTEGRANVYRDGQLVGKARQLPATVATALTANLWFPNAWAGLPTFDTCTTRIADVQVVQLEAAAGRWCDWEGVDVPCAATSDCTAWTTAHCLMPLAVAVCQNAVCRFQMDPTFGSPEVKARNMFHST